MGLPQWLNIYEIDEEHIKLYAVRKIFHAYDHEWLDFIIKSRNGKKPWKGYDYIEGGIADDRVITTIEDYINGDISMDYTLKGGSKNSVFNVLVF